MSENQIQVLLIDDHELVRSGIEHLLNEDPDIAVISVGCSGEDAVSLTSKLNPDVVLMDINMPGMGGIEAIKRIISHDPTVKIISLSVHNDGLIPKRAIDNGARGYLNKGCPVEEMIKAIITIHAGGQYISAEVASNMLFSHAESNQNLFESLSERELQITLKLIRGESIQGVAQSLNISPKTVNTHRYRMHEKLSVKSDMEMMRLASKHGLIDNLD